MRGLGLLRSGGGCGLRLLLSKTEPGRRLYLFIYLLFLRISSKDAGENIIIHKGKTLHWLCPAVFPTNFYREKIFGNLFKLCTSVSVDYN